MGSSSKQSRNPSVIMESRRAESGSLPVDTHSISISALAGSGSISLRVWEGRPWDTEIPLAGKPVVMLSSAALGSIRMKEMSSHIPKILSICLFRCQVPGIYYVSLGQVLGFRKRLMGYVMSMLWGLTKEVLTQKMHGTHCVLRKTKAGPVLWFVFWTISAWNRRAEIIKSSLWLSITSTWRSFKILSLYFSSALQSWKAKAINFRTFCIAQKKVI